MTDYQQIVDEIRFALQSEDCELTESLRQANRDYALACKEVNQQLRKIDSYLEGGLRSEAIQLAEGPPNILDVVRVLNFPEVNDWAEVAALYDLPRCEPLQLGVIDKINDALVVDQPLQKLMSRHRKLALIRAPLRMRLSVLRELMQADPETPTWEEDVRDCERARFNEMAQLAIEAQRQSNVAQLKQLQTDFSSAEWLETPPAKLVSRVRGSLANLTRQSARSEIDQLSTELEAAFGELDLSRARELRTRWDQAKRRAGLPGDDPVFEQMAPILGWVQDEDDREAAEQKYHRTIAELEAALNSETTVEHLDRLTHEIRRLDRELPDLLATRYRNRREALLLAETRLHRLQIGLSLAVLFVVVGFVGFLVRRQLQAGDVSRLATRLEKLLDQHQYAAARQTLDERNDISRWEQLTALQTRLDEEEKEDTVRQQRLAAELEQARSAATHAAALAALEKAKPLLLTPEDELEFESIQREREMRNQQQLAEREQLVREKIQAVTSALVKVDRDLAENSPDADATALLTRLTVQLAQLRADVAGLRPEISSQLNLLDSRHQELQQLDAAQSLKRKQQQELTRLSHIANNEADPAGAVRRFRAGLVAYAETLPDKQKATAVHQTAGEDPFWRAALMWSRLTTSWNDPWPRQPLDTTQRLKAVRNFLIADPGAPDAKAAQQYVDQLSALQLREGHADDLQNGLKEKLRRIYSNPLIAQSWCLTTKEGDIYYLPAAKNLPAGKLFNFSYYVGYGSEDLATQSTVKGEDLVRLETVPSASSKIAEFVINELKTGKPEHWNDFCRELCLKIQGSEEMNAYLKMDLLRRALETSSAGDVFLREELKPHLQLLEDASVNPLARWMNPGDPEGRTAIRESAEILQRIRVLPNFDDVWKAANHSREQYVDKLQTSIVMVGWLQEHNHQWSCQSSWTADGPHTLHVVHVGTDKVASQWRTIGEAGGDGLIINREAEPFLAVGRPVFAVPQRPRPVVAR